MVFLIPIWHKFLSDIQHNQIKFGTFVSVTQITPRGGQVSSDPWTIFKRHRTEPAVETVV